MDSGAASVDYRAVFFAGVFTFFAIEQYLRWRKGAALQRGLPEELAGEVGPEEYDTSRQYNTTKNRFGYFCDTYHLLVQIVQVYLWPTLWAFLPTLSPTLDAHKLLRSLTFVVVVTLFEVLVVAPLSVYSTFVIEERFGFNNYTAWKYLKDQAIGLTVNLLLTIIMWAGLISVVDYFGRDAWFYLWLFLTALVFVLNLLYPVLIAPLTNTFRPLPDGDLKAGIEELIVQTGLNCKKVFEVDGSKQSKHSNAYVSGMLGTKRIVIYDTLVKDLEGNVPMIKAVVGHEIGHSIECHNWLLMGTAMVNLFLMFWTYGFFQNTPTVATSFGFPEANTFLSLQCFMLVYCSLVMPFWSVATNAVTRALEFRADRYSVHLGYDIRPSLLKISRTNKGDLNPDWLHSLWHHSHPPLLERLRAVTALLEKRK